MWKNLGVMEEQKVFSATETGGRYPHTYEGSLSPLTAKRRGLSRKAAAVAAEPPGGAPARSAGQRRGEDAP